MSHHTESSMSKQIALNSTREHNLLLYNIVSKLSNDGRFNYKVPAELFGTYKLHRCVISNVGYMGKLMTNYDFIKGIYYISD